MKPLRIAVDARSLLCREPRGEGKSLLRLYQEMLLVRPEIEAIFFGDHKTRDFCGELPTGVQSCMVDLPGDRFAAWENLYFPALARLKGCRILHCTSSGTPRWCPLPTVMTVHDLIPILVDDGQTEQEKLRFATRLKHGIRNARSIITVSHHTKADLQRNFHELKQNVEVIHWGGEPLSMPEQSIPDASPYLIAFGGGAKRKNTDFTLERFIAIAPRAPELRLMLVGISNPRQRTEIIQRLERCQLTDRVILPGFVSETELERLVSHACALLYLSQYEGFGLPVLEAISRGVPVIAADRTSIPEILRGVPGCVPLDVPHAVEEAMLSISTNSELRRAWQQAQSTVLPRFAWRDTAIRTLAVLDACH
ncbi:MAG: glycosyltransferase family 1 protein [Rhodocyclales bacterium GT-UBC]|nr:MAG: glycosyltransferase family 1 protein [Rhodocyclales bacterium GT-UBC]